MTQSEFLGKLHTIKKFHSVSPIQQLLFHELVYKCFTKRWAKQFTWPARKLCRELQISPRALVDARARLVELRLISFTQEKKGDRGLYSLFPVIEDDTEEKTEKKQVEGHANSAQELCKICTGTDANFASHNKNNNILYINKNYIKESESDWEIKNKRKEKEEKTLFEEFHRMYPGIKRGVETEFEHFRKTHPDYFVVLPLLLPGIKKRISWVSQQQSQGLFAPQYPMLQTWINERRWEEETPRVYYE
ncbi:MAG: hypothetical protein LUG98_05490 [Tannerellaceae bacterium]|nr:hypothetical protein [Tannerellaceae bacterium]